MRGRRQTPAAGGSLFDAGHREGAFGHQDHVGRLAHVLLRDLEGLLDGVDGAREEHVLRELAVKARHEDVAGLLDRARDGVCLVGADLEVGLELGLDGGRYL